MRTRNATRSARTRADLVHSGEDHFAAAGAAGHADRDVGARHRRDPRSRPGPASTRRATSTTSAARPRRSSPSCRPSARLSLIYLASGDRGPGADAGPARPDRRRGRQTFRRLGRQRRRPGRGDRGDRRPGSTSSCSARLARRAARRRSTAVTLDRAGRLRRATPRSSTPASASTASLVRVSDDGPGPEARALRRRSAGRARCWPRRTPCISGALAAGTFPAADLGQVVQLIGAQRYLFAADAARPQSRPTGWSTRRWPATEPFTDLARAREQVVAEAARRRGAADRRRQPGARRTTGSPTSCSELELRGGRPAGRAQRGRRR